MRLETLFDSFELFAEAPNGVQKLRELILQLAVKGKLVSQKTNDESASKLVKKIRAESAGFTNGVKSRTAQKVVESEKPYQIPDNWTWIRIAEVGHDWGQKKPDVKFTYIDVSAIDKERGVISDNVYALQPDKAPSRARKIVRKGTVIYSTVRPYLLNIAVVEKDFDPEPIASTAFAIIHPFKGIEARYLYYYLRSKPFIEYVEDQMKGMAYPAINDGSFFQGLLPLPPTKEQKRIVAKVDHLMSLCDELEAKLTQAQSVRENFLASIVNHLSAT